METHFSSPFPRASRWSWLLGLAARWLPIGAIGAYIVAVTWGWHVPDSHGAPFGPVWVVASLGVAALWRWRAGSLRPTVTLAILALVGMVLTDVTTLWSQVLRDLHIYTKAGEHFLDRSPVYLDNLVTARPADLSNYPFLYPPLTLPFFAVLARLPGPVVDIGWTVVSLAIAVWSLRVFGLSRVWIAAFLLWPPFFQGIWVGNVAVPVLGLFAVAPRLPAGLVSTAVFKIYNGLTGLWLLREGGVRPFVLGLAGVTALVLVTLPIVGFGLWLAWLTGLSLYRESQPLLATSLYGFGLERYLPISVVAVVASAAVALAARVRGPASLARFGVATVVASPSLFTHGFLIAIPALLELRSTWLWVALGITSVAPGLAWWAAIALIATSWFVPALRHDALDADLHPLGREPRPWPDLEPPEPEPLRQRLAEVQAA